MKYWWYWLSGIGACIGAFTSNTAVVCFAIFYLLWELVGDALTPCGHDNHLHTQDGCTVAGCGCKQSRA